MNTYRSFGLVFWAGLSLATGASAQAVPFGPGFDGWSFTATVEKPGLVNCRAIRKVGGREDILAMRSDMTSYISVKAEGRRGNWPNVIINVPGKPRGAQEWTVKGGADAIRMWFLMPGGSIDDIAAAGIYQFSLPDSEDYGKVPLGRRSADAWERVNQCAVKYGH